MKKINLIKSNLIGFILGAIIFGNVSVWAVTYFFSSNTTYDNSNSGMQSTNVQNAIDELYNECFPPVITTNEIIEKAGLTKDLYENRYFFKGVDPNNYITFNKETWRIMSVESDGTIKIIRNYASRKEWSYSKNNWNNSDLKAYLNNTYLSSLSQKNIVVTHNWSIGKIIYSDNSLKNQINDENSSKWSGKVGLMTASEYLRANSNTSQCQSTSANNGNRQTCRTTNYLFKIISGGYYLWTLSAYDNNSVEVFALITDGSIQNVNANYSQVSFTPVVYLSSSIKLSGSGTYSDPYTIN